MELLFAPTEYTLFESHCGGHPRPWETITLKGRIEFRKDYKAILYAASQSPGIISLKYDRFEVSVTWLARGTYAPDVPVIDSIEEANQHINAFVENVKRCPFINVFQDLGIETHVFVESLKPIYDYDGARNGFWGDPLAD